MQEFRQAACAEDAQSLLNIVKSPEFDINLCGPTGTLLHWSIHNHKRLAIDLLVQHGINPELTDRNGQTALHIAATKDDYTYKLLLEKGSNPQIKDRRGFTAEEYKAIDELHAACINEDEARVLRLFSPIKANTIVEGVNYERPNALQLAASCGKHRIINTLLSAGADPNIKNRSGWTALHFAADEGHEKCVAALLCNKAVQVDCADNEQETPLCKAASKNHTSICSMLLEHKANPNVKCGAQTTPLHLLIRNNKRCLKTAEVLLKYGANSLTPDEDGDTPLKLAQNKTRKDEFLIELLSTGKLSSPPPEEPEPPVFERMPDEKDRDYFCRKWKAIRSQDALEWIYYNLIDDTSKGLRDQDSLVEILGTPDEEHEVQSIYYSQEKDYYVSLLWSGYNIDELESWEAGRIE